MLKVAVVIRHVDFEDLGCFEGVLSDHGYKIYYYDVGVNEIWTLDPCIPELLIILGGPVGVNQMDDYPFLQEEQHILEARLEANKPTLGICLGAQQMAAALGGEMLPMEDKEIGFSTLTLSDEGKQGPLAELDGVPVLHWHGDQILLPDGATQLASTEHCPVQAFSMGANILGLQFHPEADAESGLERWLVGHAAELASAGIDPSDLRDDAIKYGPALKAAGQAMLKTWLEGLNS